MRLGAADDQDSELVSPRNGQMSVGGSVSKYSRIHKKILDLTEWFETPCVDKDTTLLHETN